jgi:hypothetical protein
MAVRNDNNENIRSAIAVLAFPRIVALVIVFVGKIIQMMAGNAYFQRAVHTLAVLIAALNELHDAEKAAVSRAEGVLVAGRQSVAMGATLWLPALCVALIGSIPE